MKAAITLSDASLRDGNHAARHQLMLEQISRYATAADTAKIDIIEVGHGNGLGASSCLLGHSACTDAEMLSAAREQLTSSKLGIHFIPGLGKNADLQVAIELGADVFRIATHCTEANLARQFIEKVKLNGKMAYGVLMMSHMADAQELLTQSRLLQSYGADAIILMDSAGYSVPEDVAEKVKLLVNELEIRIGYHAHNNLGLAVANSLTAVEHGATILDACIGGFGAGAGNTQLELLVAVLARYDYQLTTDFSHVAELSKQSVSLLDIKTPHIKVINIATGVFGLFSGFSPHIERISSELNINPYQLCKRLAQRKLVAGQEDVIIEEAHRFATLSSKGE